MTTELAINRGLSKQERVRFEEHKIGRYEHLCSCLTNIYCETLRKHFANRDDAEEFGIRTVEGDVRYGTLILQVKVPADDDEAIRFRAADEHVREALSEDLVEIIHHDIDAISEQGFVLVRVRPIAMWERRRA